MDERMCIVYAWIWSEREKDCEGIWMTSGGKLGMNVFGWIDGEIKEWHDIVKLRFIADLPKWISFYSPNACKATFGLATPVAKDNAGYRIRIKL